MRKHNPKDNGVKIPFEDDLDFSNKWQEWILFREQRRLPRYVPVGLKGTFTRLVNMANNDPKIAIEIIQRSMDNNWQGLFPLPQTNPNGTHNQVSVNGKGTSEARVDALKNWGLSAGE
jgi:hypothetical protein